MKRFIFLLIFAQFIILSGCSSKLEQARPNVIVILLDTLRADHLGYYGYSRPTSPVIDQFANENIAFNYCVTAAPWTPPAVASLMTGLYPSSHSMMPLNSRKDAKANDNRLPSSALTLAEVLSKNGYLSAAVSSNPWINRDFGYDQGFSYAYQYLPRARAGAVTDEGRRLINELQKKDKPFFLYLHYLDPHDPYDAPGEYKQMFASHSPGDRYKGRMATFMNRYDGEIRYLDSSLGKLFDSLRSSGLYEKTAIVLLADHGEQFMEHGFHTHGFTVHNEEVHVPLIVKLPGAPVSKKIDTTVSTIDVFPTVLQMANIKEERTLQSVSLLDEEKLKSRTGVISEINRRLTQRAFVSSTGEKIIFGTEKPGTDLELAQFTNALIGIYDRKGDYLELTPQLENKDRSSLTNSFKTAFNQALELRVGE